MNTKICQSCETEKDSSQFWKRRGSLQPNCISCQSAINKARYAANPSRQKANALKNMRQRFALFQQWKQTLHCCNCEESSAVCLDFHHIDESTKLFEVGGSAGDTSFARLDKEIQKCVVVCSNCHRKIHAEELVLSEEALMCSKLLTEQFRPFWVDNRTGRGRRPR